MSDPIHSLSLYNVLQEHTRSYPGKVALAWDNQRLTYVDVIDRVDRYIAALAAAGVGRG